MAVTLFAMTCGWLTADIGNFLAGETGQVRVPVPAYLIVHPKGRVLFDTGLHTDTQHDPRGRVGALADHFQVGFQPGEEIKSRLAALDTDADRIDFIINSHLHWDHTGGNETIPNARLIIQKREWEAGHVSELIEANSFIPADYDHGHDVIQVDGAHDLFGDGTVVTVPTYGHTPGHQSLKVRLASGDVVMTADACYMRKTIEDLHLPPRHHDGDQMRASLRALRKLEAAGARIFYGHDPDFWKSVPQAPIAIH
jgi:glyoxylase-like metal-dependent hydrolase (beta-lactamase superfamily II)